MRGTGLGHICLPSGEELRTFPETVVEKLKSIALTILRRLFYPILQRRVASLHRRKALALRWSREELENKTVLAMQQLSAPMVCAQAKGMTKEIDQVSCTLKNVMRYVDYRLFTQGEIIEYAREPANAVVVVLVGSVTKRVVISKRKSRSVLVNGMTSRPSTATMSIIQDGDDMSQVSCVSSRNSMQRGSFSSPHGDTSPIPATLAAAAAVAAAYSVICAPAVLGEYATVGAYPSVDYIIADSPLVVTASLPRQKYIEVIEAFPKGIQQEVLLAALKMREKLLPRFAPMTVSRMRLCPLFTELSDDSLLHLMDYLVPWVRAAGMQLSELDTPQHIFFIRRGAVRIHHDESFVANLSASSQPKSRSLLLDGHTFGERQCIFHEALGDSFYALTNVDLYVLPFSVLIQFMKQQPDARTAIYASAKAASLALENEYEGMRFVPPSLDNLNLVVLGYSELSKWFNRRVSITTASSRRATVLGCSTTDTTSNSASLSYQDFGVSPHFIERIRRIPLLNLLSPDDAFYIDCALHWKLLSFETGEYIVRRGSECNCLLLFPQGGAAVVRNEKKLSQSDADAAATPPPLSRATSLTQIPCGCTIGYTCVRRHLWTHSVVAVENEVEVWELKRSVFVELLRKHGLQRRMQEISLQLLQPLVRLPSRSTILDMQPVLKPSPNSLWSEYRIPNLHPVSMCEYMLYPVWKEGDFPLEDRTAKHRASLALLS